MSKKIILFLLVLIIIPNTFAEITIEVLPAPVISAELVEGGDLSPNTTYYFAAFFSLSSIYGGDATSPMSNMTSITTTDTHKSIKISWQTQVNSSNKIFIRWDTFSLQDENGEYILQESYRWTTLPYTGHTGLEYLFTQEISPSHDCHNSHPEISLLPEYLDARLNRKKGLCVLTITGEETYENLMDTIRNSDHNDMFIINNNSFTTLCSIYGTGSLTFENKNIKFLYTKNFNSNITFQNCLIFGQYRKANIRNYGVFNNCSINAINLYQYSFYDQISNSKLFVDAEFGLSEKHKNLDITNTRYTFYFGATQNRILKNISSKDKHLVLYLSNGYRNKETYIYNSYFENSGNYDLYFFSSTGYGYPQVEGIDDSNYNFYNSYSNRKNRLPLVSYVDQTGWIVDCRVKAKLFYTQYFNITDKFGNPIDQAKITIKDSNNTIVSEIYTDINGSVDYNLMTHLIEYDETNANGLRSKYHYQGPFTIIISNEKQGFYNYRTIEEIISEKNYKISLQN